MAVKGVNDVMGVTLKMAKQHQTLKPLAVVACLGACLVACRAQSVSGITIGVSDFKYWQKDLFNGWYGNVGPEHDITMFFSNYTETPFQLSDVQFQIFDAWDVTDNYATSGLTLKLVVQDDSIGFGEYQYRKLRIRYEAPFATAPVYGRFRGRFNVRHQGTNYYSNYQFYHIQKEPVPEPATAVIFASGLVLLFRRRRKL
ncbi:MAG: PEP-CTERM sorting domain-containing protein [Fimbriimonadaceae bacterium]|nr:PEP-CTERM sorting domain-containing protein [Fimbriimonadaceae bacterium]